MQSRNIAHRSVPVIGPRNTRIVHRCWFTLAVLIVVAAYGLAGHWDAQANFQLSDLVRADRALEIENAFEAGRSQGHEDMAASTHAAWQAAQLESGFRCARTVP